jgi:ribosomal protein L11 methyltransferase
MAVFVELESILPAAAEDELAQCLSSLPVLGVHLEPRSIDRVRVGVWLDGGDDTPVGKVIEILEQCGSKWVRRREQASTDWSVRWRESLQPFPVGRSWWIDPHPNAVSEVPSGRRRISVEPRAAFGSGTHESTQLVLMELEDLNCGGRRVLDLGTGSGILAVAAEIAGARVVAVDTDPIAGWEARQSARIQNRPCQPAIVVGGVESLGPARFDVILCNMIITEFGPLLGEIHRLLSVGGQAVFSGILDCELSAARGLLVEHGLASSNHRSLRGWNSVRVGRAEDGP